MPQRQIRRELLDWATSTRPARAKQRAADEAERTRRIKQQVADLQGVNIRPGRRGR
jgi:hypothetical protein